MGKKNLCNLFLVSLILLLFGCSSIPRVQVNIDSLCSNEMVGKKSYILLPGNEDTNVNDLQFKEYAKSVVSG